MFTTYSCCRNGLVASLCLMMGSVLVNGQASAQGCNNPLPLIHSDNPFLQVTTCGQQSMASIGGAIPLLHDHVVIAFGVDHRHIGNLNLTADFPATFFLMPGRCNESAMPIDTFLPGQTLSLDFSRPTGMYFLVATGDLGLPPNQCGTISIIGNLFETEVVLRSGFDPPGW